MPREFIPLPRKNPEDPTRWLRDGYVYVWNGERAVLEHRYVWAQAYGPIPPGHYILHRDLDRQNNALDNLEMLSKAEHWTRSHPGYDDQFLIECMQTLAREAGRTPTIAMMNARAGFPAGSTFVKHFGTWKKAARAAGLKPNRGGRRQRRR
jgi:hypothetical protein